MQIINDRSRYISVPTFCYSFLESWCENPSCGRCVVFSRTPNLSTTSPDEKSIEFEFQTDRNVYVDLRQTYLALKNKLVKGRGFESYRTTENKKEHKEDAVFTETGDDDVESIEEDEGVPHITHVNNILHSIFFVNQNCTLTTTKSTIRTDFMLANLTFLTISKVHCQITRESCIVKGMTMKMIQKISSKVYFSLEE